MQSYKYSDDVFTFEGAVSVELTEHWAAPWRIPVDQSELYPKLVDVVAKACSGIRIAFITNSKHVVLDIEPYDEPMCFDLLVDGKLRETVQTPVNADRVEFQPLDEGTHSLEIWLDPRSPLRLRTISLDQGAEIWKAENNRPRWIHYGSSISHAKAARTPSQTWPALVAQRAGLRLTNLGFGGNCVLEPMIGRLIRDLPAEFISLKLGINVHGGALTRRTFAPNAIGLIALIREKHPHVPLAVISPIYSPQRETVSSTSESLCLVEMRQALADIVCSFQKYGDTNIHYVDGLSIFGPAQLQYLPDKLHPNAEGQFPLADNFMQQVIAKIRKE